MTAGAGTFNFATGALTAKDKGNDNDQFVAPPLSWIDIDSIAY